MNVKMLRSSFAAVAGVAMVLFGAPDRAKAADAATPEPKAEESPIEVSIAIPWSFDEHREIWSHGSFHVLITNTSGQPQNIWKAWNSWGYYGLSFEVTDEHGKTWTVHKGEHIFGPDGPDYWTIDPHESLVIDVDYSSAEWEEGFPPSTKEPRIFTMRAIFEIKPDGASKKYSVWTGRVVSKVGTYTLYR